MPITVVPIGPINNPAVPSKNQRDEAQTVIAQLRYADLWRGAGTLRRSPLVRVDMQGVIPGPSTQHNIQVQLNGVHGRSTIAHVLVSESIMSGNIENQQGALRKVISALNQSLDTVKSYRVDGSNP